MEDRFSVITAKETWPAHIRLKQFLTAHKLDNHIEDCLSLAHLNIAALPNFYTMQSAYHASHTTETAFIKIVDDILQSIDSGFIVALVNLYISAAFDTVNHANTNMLMI